ncbi:zf-TFIIB domain-containing protein [Pyxidicoccus trucidator]|uniref:zf-TFIIB domain-containing protein n=1 Tax=Pyxidicoccus trucidator TaxID=2709662 RepID=UPI0013D99ACE|nr:zf-TFIIB domain-containing protein [Pyxidicoccus trucidator]
MRRHCPICPQKPLRDTQLNGVLVATCDSCKGHWMEHDELERLTPAWKTDAPWAALHDAPRRCPHAQHHVPASRENCGLCGRAAARCPTCDEHLSQVRMQACAVDVCSRCHGLWLDASELELLRRAPRHSLRPLVGAAAVAAATAAALAASQSTVVSSSPIQEAARDVATTTGEVVAEVAVEVVAEGALEVIVDGAGTVIEVAVEGASAVGVAVGEAMAAVLAAIADALN